MGGGQAMFNLDEAIEAWRHEMLSQDSLNVRRVRELESHLSELLEARVAEGDSAENAFATAREELGSPAAIDREFRKVYPDVPVLRKVFWFVLGYLALDVAFRLPGVVSYVVEAILFRIGIHRPIAMSWTFNLTSENRFFAPGAPLEGNIEIDRIGASMLISQAVWFLSVILVLGISFRMLTVPGCRPIRLLKRFGERVHWQLSAVFALGLLTVGMTGVSPRISFSGVSSLIRGDYDPAVVGMPEWEYHVGYVYFGSIPGWIWILPGVSFLILAVALGQIAKRDYPEGLSYGVVGYFLFSFLHQLVWYALLGLSQWASFFIGEGHQLSPILTFAVEAFVMLGYSHFVVQWLIRRPDSLGAICRWLRKRKLIIAAVVMWIVLNLMLIHTFTGSVQGGPFFSMGWQFPVALVALLFCLCLKLNHERPPDEDEPFAPAE
jgi:hypothetical protein